ncbi:MAG: DNA primase [Treponema sp.]|nr:DNA primase [Treponema sp.]
MAGIISRDTIDAVLNTSDIVSVVGEYTRLEKRSGNDWWGCCPFHNEKSASFHVDGDKKFYYCFGCHAGGDVIKFVQEMEKITYPDAVKLLAKRSNVEITYTNGSVVEHREDDHKAEYIELYTRVTGTFHYLLTQTPMGKFALEYITKRGLTLETIEKFKLGYAPADRRWLKQFLREHHFSDEFLAHSGLFSNKYPDVAFFSDRLIFPIFNRNGQAVAMGGRLLRGEGPKYLNSGDLIQYKKGETLYGFNFAKDAIRTNKKVIFCEGYMDCIAYHQCGITYAVAPLGTALTEQQIRIVKGFADEVLLSFDSDGAGQAATMRAMLMLRKEGMVCRVIQLKGGKDPAEIMLTYGVEALTTDVKNAILDSDFLLSKLGKEYPVSTPEGKTKASLAFFPYVDALQSDIQKSSCLEQLCQTFNLNPDAVRRDFYNREQAQERMRKQSLAATKVHEPAIVLNSELRAIMAVVTDLSTFEMMRSELSVQDFEDPLAQQIFIALEDSYKEGESAFTLNGILNRCENKELQQLITRVIANNEFSDNTKKIVQDSISLIKRNSLERQKEVVMTQIRTASDAHDADALKTLLAAKMNIDKKLQSM